jgi:tetratricopeptide (TPR) repeat protein
MISRDHMTGRLPEPAPAPEAREAAIAQALQQFDRRHEAPARDSSQRPLRQAAALPPRRMRLATPAVRYLAAASVALFIAAPAAWFAFNEIQQREDRPTAAGSMQDRIAPVPPQADGAAPAPAAPSGEAPPAPSRPPAPLEKRNAPPALGYSAPEPAPPQPRQAERSDTPAASSASPPALPPPPVAARPAERSESLAARSGEPRPAAPQPRAAAPQPLAKQKVPGAAARGGQDDWDGCRAGDPERKIIGCARIIEDSSRTASDRRDALVERGKAYAQRGNLDRAIADLTDAIRLDPANAAAFYNRSLAYRAKGESERANADCARASALDPAYRSRCSPDADRMIRSGSGVY